MRMETDHLSTAMLDTAACASETLVDSYSESCVRETPFALRLADYSGYVVTYLMQQMRLIKTGTSTRATLLLCDASYLRALKVGTREIHARELFVHACWSSRSYLYVSLSDDVLSDVLTLCRPYRLTGHTLFRF
jgi:hypothetical protein